MVKHDHHHSSTMTNDNGCTVVCTVSRYESRCAICSSKIIPGDRIFPFVPPSEDNGKTPANGFANKPKQSLAWGHEPCYHPSLPAPPNCRHWVRLGRCPALNLGMCAFLHDENQKGGNVDTTKNNDSNVNDGSSLAKRRWGGKRNWVRNQHKNSVFRIFLMQTYGIDYLTEENSTLIDVAGGKGELSWELTNLTGVKDCVVVDPRPLNLGLCETKWKKGMFEPRRTGPVFSKWYPACKDGCKLQKSKWPRHIRCFFDCLEFLKFMEAGKDGKEVANEWYNSELKKAKSISWTTKGLSQHEDGESHNGSDEPNMNHVDAYATSSNKNERGKSEIDNPDVARNALARCNLIIGFHPDQAAGEIADFAMARNIPWVRILISTHFKSSFL